MATQHTTEFRQEAVRAALTSGLSRKQVSTDFGVGSPSGGSCVPLRFRRIEGS